MIGRPSHVKWYEYSYRQALANHSRDASANSWSDAIARIIFALRCSKSSVDRVTGSLVGRRRARSRAPASPVMERVRAVPLRHRPRRKGPADLEGRVVPPHASGGTWMVELRHLIENLAAVLERLVPVGQPLRNIDHAEIVARELEGQPVAEGGRSGPDVQGHVVDRPAGASDQLRLRVGRDLVVHSAKRSLLEVESDVALRDGRIEAAGLELAPGPGAREETALVHDPLGIDREEALQRRRSEDQAGSVLTRSDDPGFG